METKKGCTLQDISFGTTQKCSEGDRVLYGYVILTHLEHTEALTQRHQELEFLSLCDGWFAKSFINVVRLNTSGASGCDTVWTQEPRCQSWEGESPGSGP